MRKVNALKNLFEKMTGEKSTSTTTSEIIQDIADNYEGGGLPCLVSV